MRIYEPIWDKLKKDKKVTLVSVPALHKRIIKAVKKEKNMDILFKFECSQNCKKARLISKVDGKKLTFMLKLSIGMDDL